MGAELPLPVAAGGGRCPGAPGAHRPARGEALTRPRLLTPQVLQSQLDTLLEGQESIKSCSNFTAQALNHGTETEVLLVKKQMSEKLNELADQDFPLHPRENDQLDFIVETEGLKKSIHNLGTILTTNAVASETVATGEGLRQTIIGQPMSVTITTKDKDGELCKTGNAYITAELSTPDGSVADGEILDNKNGTYEFLYTVQKEGDFTLSLRLYDQHIRGSPFKLKVIRSADVSPTTEGVKRRVKSPGSGHVKQKAVKRPASMYSTGKRKENPIEDDLIFRVGKEKAPPRLSVAVVTGQLGKRCCRRERCRSGLGPDRVGRHWCMVLGELMQPSSESLWLIFRFSSLLPFSLSLLQPPSPPPPPSVPPCPLASLPTPQVFPTSSFSPPPRP